MAVTKSHQTILPTKCCFAVQPILLVAVNLEKQAAPL